MRAAWLEQREESTARRLALLPLLPVSWLVRAGAALHPRLYRSRWWRPTRLPCRVISVGSLVAGGAGKTPLAAWLAGALHARGHRVALASRGYGRRGGGRVDVISDGRRVYGRAETGGDEPMVLAAHTPGVPVLVGSDRALVGWRALSAFGTEILVLDDGFQHHRLRRDLDLVVFDGALGLGNGHGLPRGPLREPVSALARADAIGVVDPPLTRDEEDWLARLAPGARRFSARRQPGLLRPLAGGRGEPAGRLDGAEVGMLCGLARPSSLRLSLEKLGARVVAERCFADHHRYRIQDLAGLAQEAPLWITTEKDAVKMPASWARGADVRVLTLTLAVDAEAELLDWVEASLRGPRPAFAGGASPQRGRR